MNQTPLIRKPKFCHIDKDGNVYAREDEESPYRERLNEYHTIQYNNVIDYKNRIEEFFMLEGSELPEITESFITHGTEATETTQVTTAVPEAETKETE